MSLDVVTGHGGDTVHTWNARLEDEANAASERLFRSRAYRKLRLSHPLVPAAKILAYLTHGDGEPLAQFLCPGHEWRYTGTAYGGDDESYHGEGVCYCCLCGADGDA